MLSMTYASDVCSYCYIMFLTPAAWVCVRPVRVVDAEAVNGLGSAMHISPGQEQHACLLGDACTAAAVAAPDGLCCSALLLCCCAAVH